jgi:hypothetical protein
MIREYGEEIWRNYNLLKAAVLNQEGARWTPHTSAWLWSIAAGRDVFPWLQAAFGTSVSRDQAQLPSQVLEVGFDPLAVGKLYNVPLVRLTPARDLLSRLPNVAAVRAFYAQESAAKGRPAKED